MHEEIHEETKLNRLQVTFESVYNPFKIVIWKISVKSTHIVMVCLILPVTDS